MFDTTVHKTETRVTPVTRIIEQSISPDKVTEVYELVRQEVIGQMIEAYTITSNTLNAVIIEAYEDMNDKIIVYNYGFELNGEKYHGKIKHEPRFSESSHALVNEVFEKFYSVIVSKVAPKVMPEIVKMSPIRLK